MDLIGHLRIWGQRGSYINRDGHSGPENRAGRERCFHLSGKGKKDPKGDPEVIRADIHSTGPSLVSEASERPPHFSFRVPGGPCPTPQRRGHHGALRGLRGRSCYLGPQADAAVTPGGLESRAPSKEGSSPAVSSHGTCLARFGARITPATPSFPVSPFWDRNVYSVSDLPVFWKDIPVWRGLLPR